MTLPTERTIRRGTTAAIIDEAEAAHTIEICSRNTAAVKSQLHVNLPCLICRLCRPQEARAGEAETNDDRRTRQQGRDLAEMKDTVPVGDRADCVSHEKEERMAAIARWRSLPRKVRWRTLAGIRASAAEAMLTPNSWAACGNTGSSARAKRLAAKTASPMTLRIRGCIIGFSRSVRPWLLNSSMRCVVACTPSSARRDRQFLPTPSA